MKPNEIYEDFRSRNVDKSKTIESLITLIENIDDDIVRKESIDILNKIDVKHKNVFKILENILISDSNENLRYAAAKVIKNKFLNKAIIPFLWVLQHESSYDFLITIIKSLEDLSDDRIDSMLIEEIKKISIDKYKKSIDHLSSENNLENFSHKELAEIIINHITLRFLGKKFNKLEFEIKNGLVISLDFSKVDNLIIYWRDRAALQDCSDVMGIQNLKNLERIQFFSLQWTFNNDLSYQSSITLIKALEQLNNNVAKETLISQIYKIENKKYKLSIKDQFKNFPVSKLADILRNYITISFLKKKHSQLKYKVEDGEIVEIFIEKEPLITLPEFIEYFSSLRSLTLKNCSLHALPESIGAFKYLELLDLEGNSLKSLPKSISFLTSLKSLNLSKNDLIKIPFPIGGLYRLNNFDLENNKLIQLPKSMGYLSSLILLNVSRNNLKTLPSSIGSLKTLQNLQLSFNRIISLPESIGLLYSLENLNLDNNELTNLPSSINSISSLKMLSLEDNELKDLPNSLNLLMSLEILKLGWNQLKKLPDSIGSMKSLKYLRLTSNQIQNFPDSICLLSSLEWLDASENQINMLPEQVGKLKALKVLKLSGNQITLLPDSICLLGKLEKLDFCSNEIEFLPKAINSLSSLKEIWLNGNRLRSLPTSIGNLPLLKKLKLVNNKNLTYLPKSLENMPSLDISVNWNIVENSSEFTKFFKKELLYK